MTQKREITRADILPMAEYAKVRAARRKELVEVKRNRRVAVGPYATFYFENYDTMWLQIHEMLYIERGGEEQIADELSAYNPLVPKGAELVATVMFEIDDPVRRKTVLGKLGGVEDTFFLELGGERVTGTPEADVDRTNASGKASSVQFVHFHLNPAQVQAFREPGTRVILGVGHEHYPHMTVLPEAVRAELSRDLA